MFVVGRGRLADVDFNVEPSKTSKLANMTADFYYFRNRFRKLPDSLLAEIGMRTHGSLRCHLRGPSASARNLGPKQKGNVNRGMSISRLFLLTNSKK